MTNVVRHSQADAVTTSLSFGEQEVILRIQDNGAGFSQERVGQEHQGLRNMARGAEELGGAFAVESIVSQGTSIELRLPLR